MKHHFLQRNAVALAVGVALAGSTLILPAYAFPASEAVGGGGTSATNGGTAVTGTPAGVPEAAEARAQDDPQAQTPPASSTNNNEGTPNPAAPAIPASKSKKNVTTLGAVVVTGQLQALEQAQATKRNSVGIVDSVSAEEAGKFPDPNVADALQRVPGVSVDRSGGESNQITVRGFGPSFVNVLINGRTMATASPDRSFDFDVLPTELIQQAIVHKTGMANLPAGGIGGTVNIITAQPSDFSGFHTAFSAAGIYDHTDGGPNGKVTPKVDFMIGNTNADHTFGWLISGLYYKRNHLQQSVEADGWDMGLDYSDIDPSLTNVSVPQTVQLNYWPQTYVRKSINAAIDWHPTDKLTVNFNTLLASFSQTGTQYSFGSILDEGDIEALQAAPNGAALQFMRSDQGVLSNDYIESSNPVHSKNEQTGLHITYQIDPSMEIDLDSSISKAWNKPSQDGFFTVVGTRNFGVNPVWTNNGPNHLGSYHDILPTTDVNALYAHYFSTGSQNVSDQIQQNNLHLSKDFMDGPLTKLDFGVESSNRVKNIVTWEMPGSPGNGFGAVEYNGYVAQIPANAIGAHVLNAGSLVGGVSPGSPTSWVVYDPAQLLAYYASAAAYGQLADPEAFKAMLDANGGSFAARPDPITQSRISERVRSAYVMANFEGNIGAMPWQLNAGVRYTITDTGSSGYHAPLLNLTSNPIDPSVVISDFGPAVAVDEKSNYNNWLPSLNFKLNIRDDLIFRFALSKTLTRPELASLGVGQEWDFSTPQDIQLIEGNASLKPFTSINYDAGLEWYFSDQSYVALDIFKKDVSNFTTAITTVDDMFGFPIHVTRPVNLNEAKVRGAEFTFNYQFKKLPSPFNGFGVSTNYTYVHSNATVNPDIIATTGVFAIPGMGNSYNANLYFQKYGLQARLAWNWRANYLSSLANDYGFPETTRSYGQLDFSASYDINPHLSVFLEGTNLNNEKIFSYQVFQNMGDYAEANGQTWTTGIRGSW